jgi:hypothetical protein
MAAGGSAGGSNAGAVPAGARLGAGSVGPGMAAPAAHRTSPCGFCLLYCLTHFSLPPPAKLQRLNQATLSPAS